MGKKGPKMPPLPNFRQEGQFQEEANKRAAYENMKLNQGRQKTPYGEVYYTGDIGSENRTKHVTLDPNLQKQMDQQMAMNAQMMNRATQSLNHMPNTALTYDHLPEMRSDYSTQAAQLEKAHLDHATSLLKPMMDDQKRAMDVELSNRGIPLGSEAYQKATGDLRTNHHDTLSKIAMNAVEAGRQEQSRQFDMARLARQQGINEQIQARQYPLNEVATLMGQQMQTLPESHFESLGQNHQQPVNYMPSIHQNYRASLAAQQEKEKRKMLEMRGLLGLGKAFLGGM